jgi:hypothetical protein
VCLCVCCIPGWLEPLLDRIARDSTTVVCPVIDVIDDTTLEYHWRDSGGVNVGGFDWNLQVPSALQPHSISSIPGFRSAFLHVACAALKLPAPVPTRVALYVP